MINHMRYDKISIFLWFDFEFEIDNSVAENQINKKL